MRISFYAAVLLAAAAPTIGKSVSPSVAPPAADRYAGFVKAGGWVDGPSGREYVELLIDGDEAALRRRPEGVAKAKFLILANPDDPLMALADRRLEMLWAPLTEWTGPTFDRMRERMIRRSRAALNGGGPDLPAGNTSESTVRPEIRAVLQYARALDLTGRGAEAEAMLRERLVQMQPKRGVSWRGIEWQSVTAAIAWSRSQRNDQAGAIAEYEAVERTLGTSPYAVNATVNRAATLAYEGRYAEALTAIDGAWARYLKDNRGDKVPGSERQFSWIRACALHGLGRTDEARGAMPVLQDDREIKDADFVIEPDNDLKLRIATCTRDGPEFARLIARDLRRVGRSPALLLLQPAYIPRGNYRAIMATVRADPALKAAAASLMRTLPPEMTAALNGWRGARADATPSGSQ